MCIKRRRWCVAGHLQTCQTSYLYAERSRLLLIRTWPDPADQRLPSSSSASSTTAPFPMSVTLFTPSGVEKHLHRADNTSEMVRRPSGAAHNVLIHQLRNSHSHFVIKGLLVHYSAQVPLFPLMRRKITCTHINTLNGPL